MIKANDLNISAVEAIEQEHYSQSLISMEFKIDSCIRANARELQEGREAYLTVDSLADAISEKAIIETIKKYREFGWNIEVKYASATYLLHDITISKTANT